MHRAALLQCSKTRSYRAFLKYTSLFGAQQAILSHRAVSNRIGSAQTKSFAVDRTEEKIVLGAGAKELLGEPGERQSTAGWLELLDPFLPLNLRSKSWMENLQAFHGIRRIERLPWLLHTARNHFKGGILTHLSIQEGRWDALHWLVKSLVSIPRHSDPDLQQDLWEGCVFRQRDDESLERFLLDEAVADLHKASSNLDPLDKTISSIGTSEYSQDILPAIGQIWRCLGHMVLTAADSQPYEKAKILSWLQHILAVLHTSDAMPSLIYEYDREPGLNPVEKPPFLHMMSARIMASLADMSWKVDELRIMGDAAFVAAAHALHRRSDKQSLLDSIPLEIWMELILWSCVHSGFFREATDIVKRMSRCKDTERWSVRSWDQLNDHQDPRMIHAPGPYWTSTWFSRLAGATDVLEDLMPASFPERTVSSEVIATIADGVISSLIHGVREDEDKRSVWAEVEACARLLQPGDGSETLQRSPIWTNAFWAVTTKTAIEGKRSCAMAQPSSSSQSLGRRPDHELAQRQHRIEHYTLLKDLHAYVTLADANGAFRSLQRFRSWLEISLERDCQLPDIIFDLTKESESDPRAHRLQYMSPQLRAALLHLFVNQKHFEGASIVLCPVGSKEIYIPESYLHDLHMQSALFRYASLTAKSGLVARIIQTLTERNTKLNSRDMNDLLTCQICFRSWDRAWDLLDSIKGGNGDFIQDDTIALLASTAFPPPDHEQQLADVSEARRMLGAIIRGGYLPSNKDLGAELHARIRKLNQLAQILGSSGNEIADFISHLDVPKGVEQRVAEISTEAFNTMLEMVVVRQSLKDAKEFSERWCDWGSLPWKEAQGFQHTRSALSNSQRPVVVPDLKTVRILIAAAADLDSEIKPFPLSKRSCLKAKSELPSQADFDNQVATSPQYKPRKRKLRLGPASSPVPLLSRYVPKFRADILVSGYWRCRRLGLPHSSIFEDFPTIYRESQPDCNERQLS